MQPEPMSLEQLEQILDKNETVAPSTIDAIEYHAAKLGHRVTDNYEALNMIVLRHELLIRKRWIKMSRHKRRALLLAIMPHMPQDHLSQALTSTIPFINLKSLTQSRPLLAFINARGRKLPWTFACIEEEFLVLGRTVPCTDLEFCEGVGIMFSRDPDPATYGKIIRDRLPGQDSRATEDYFEMCARSSIRVLKMQEYILSFLVQCITAILHDIPWEQLFDHPIQDEPPPVDLLEDDEIGHATFSNVLLAAPYLGWDSVNFVRLQGYVSAILDAQKEHIRAMREDPGYFADTLWEFEQHAPYKDQDALLQPFQRGSIDRYQSACMMYILDEAYSMFSFWTEIDRRVAQLPDVLKSDMSLHDQAHIVGEARLAVKSTKNVLMTKLDNVTFNAPRIREFLHPKTNTETGEVHFVPKKPFSSAQRDLVDELSGMSTLSTPALVSLALERLDHRLRTSPEATSMMSSRLLNLITDTSVLSECLRQFSLWEKSPKVAAERCHHTCTYQLMLSEVEEFQQWNKKIHDYAVPMGIVQPFREKLNYPVHKRRTRENVNAVRQAEANLDQLWAMIDEYFEKQTGVSQHRLIRECLQEGGDVYRTPPWVDPVAIKLTPKEKPEYVYQPLSRMVHSKTLEITGAFDRMAIEEKTKAKTRGDTITVAHDLAALPPDSNATATPQPTILVDQRAHKVFKTLFHTPTSETGDLPKGVKWVEFKRAMARVGFSVEKLQGSAWQFAPGDALDADRNIQFHEPHPGSDIPYIMAKRFGRRLARVYGWSGDTFKLG
ncbi:uncharacterized protein J4E92_002837 [Alternaria infectoria]|uniref:uncharacterized protein n=1 Tax=Alternaria infectoria TaxID=45303 RepID=UPI0022208D03|nr:uncharacterized protein J4E92_002837 [Alternaria infectoria]KAI4935546.1 hypothetical protein J4E92_002837 [Alternaria infectoria]